MDHINSSQPRTFIQVIQDCGQVNKVTDAGHGNIPGQMRKRNPGRWVRNIKSRLRLQGKEYVGYRNKVYPAVTEGPPCNCKLKCFEIVSAEDRLTIRSAFYNLPDFTTQRYFIGKCIKSTSKKREYSLRKVSFEYNVNIQGIRKRICKNALSSILGMKKYRIDSVCSMIKKYGTPQNDRRGMHDTRPNRIPESKKDHVRSFINKLPKYKSHYTRRYHANRHYLSAELTINKMHALYVEECIQSAKEPVSIGIFSDIFTKEFKIHFGHPNLDTCDICKEWSTQIESISYEERRQMIDEHESHLQKVQLAHDMIKKDFMINDDLVVIAFDLQQPLPTPHLNTNVVFYNRQLWTYNLCIHDSTGQSHMHMWSEDQASRGPEEIISCLNNYIHYITNAGILQNNTSLIAWSNSCGGLNKNKMIMSFWYYVVHIKKIFASVQHKFSVSGHSHLVCERDFQIIKEKKKRTPVVYDPESWFQLVEKAKTKNPFNVVRMTQQKHFVSIRPFTNTLNFRKNDVNGEPVHLRNAARVIFSRDHEKTMFIGYTHDPLEILQEVNIAGEERVNCDSIDLPRLYNRRRPIPAPKCADIMKLCALIPEKYREFYTGLSIVKRPIKLRYKANKVVTVHEESDVAIVTSDSD